MKNFSFNLNLVEKDIISKFNIFNFKLLKKLSHLIFFVKLNANDSTFLRDLYFISKLAFFWFNKKIVILKAFKEKKNTITRGKTSLIFFVGCTIRNLMLLKSLNYVYNVIFLLSKKFDGKLKYKVLTNGFIYSFSNINFLLGLRSDRYFNSNLKLNLLFRFNVIKSFALKKGFENKIIKFYEKVFF